MKKFFLLCIKLSISLFIIAQTTKPNRINLADQEAQNPQPESYPRQDNAGQVSLPATSSKSGKPARINLADQESEPVQTATPAVAPKLIGNSQNNKYSKYSKIVPAKSSQVVNTVGNVQRANTGSQPTQIPANTNNLQNTAVQVPASIKPKRINLADVESQAPAAVTYQAPQPAQVQTKVRPNRVNVANQDVPTPIYNEQTAGQVQTSARPTRVNLADVEAQSPAQNTYQPTQPAQVQTKARPTRVNVVENSTPVAEATTTPANISGQVQTSARPARVNLADETTFPVAPVAPVAEPTGPVLYVRSKSKPKVAPKPVVAKEIAVKTESATKSEPVVATVPEVTIPVEQPKVESKRVNLAEDSLVAQPAPKKEDVRPIVLSKTARKPVVKKSVEPVEKLSSGTELTVSSDENINGLSGDLFEKAKQIASSFHLRFKFNSSQLVNAEIDKIVALSTILKENKNFKLRITGHTDNVGTLEANYIVGTKRANVVKLLFTDEGVDENQLISTSRAYLEPLVPNVTAKDMAKNRRVEMEIGKGGVFSKGKAKLYKQISKSGKADNNSNLITTVAIEAGSRLTLLSEEYYGHKSFWVYIYEANKDHIANPGMIMAGTMIKIPKLSDSQLNRNDANCLRKLKELHDLYVK